VEIGNVDSMKADDMLEEEISMDTEKISMIVTRCNKRVGGIQFGYFKNSDERNWKLGVTKSFSSDIGEERVKVVKGIEEIG